MAKYVLTTKQQLCESDRKHTICHNDILPELHQYTLWKFSENIASDISQINLMQPYLSVNCVTCAKAQRLFLLWTDHAQRRKAGNIHKSFLVSLRHSDMREMFSSCRQRWSRNTMYTLIRSGIINPLQRLSIYLGRSVFGNVCSTNTHLAACPYPIIRRSPNTIYEFTVMNTALCRVQVHIRWQLYFSTQGGCTKFKFTSNFSLPGIHFYFIASS